MNFRLSPFNLPFLSIYGPSQTEHLYIRAARNAADLLTHRPGRQFRGRRIPAAFAHLSRPPKASIFPITSNPACLPLISVTGRRKPRSAPGDPPQSAFGPKTGKKRRKTASESLRGPRIALDRLLRGVVFSANSNYQNILNSPPRVDIRPESGFFLGNSLLVSTR